MPLKENPDTNRPYQGYSGSSPIRSSLLDDYDNAGTTKSTGGMVEENPEDSDDSGYPDPSSERSELPYNTERVRRFLIYLAKAVKRHDIRKDAHNDFHSHVEKIKKMSPKGMDDEIDELKRKVSYLIEIEKGHTAPMNDKFSKEKIQLIEGKLNKLLESKQRREDRFVELERKINSKMVSDKKEISKLKTKLLTMEKKLIEMQLKSKSKAKTKKLNELKDQIRSTKQILEEY